MTKRLLIAYAHPDDESFGNGGLISKYVAQGIEVYYICATNGDVGSVPDDMKDLYPTIAELRLAELACASAKLGFKQVFTFGYKDSGMMGSPTNQDPECLWYHGQHHPEQVTKRVVEVIRQVKPQVILTFNRYGGYGHPDHIAIQRATTEAFQLAGDTHYQTEQPAYQPQKLYYGGLPNFMLKAVLFWMKLRGVDVRRMGLNKDIDYQAIIDNLEPYHASVDIRDYLDAWDDASACHKSQGGGGLTRGLPKWVRRIMFAHQTFTRVHPVPSRNRIDEKDLFEGVQA